LQSNRTPATNELFAAVLDVAARLGDQGLIDLYERVLADSNEPPAVRTAGAHGLGTMTDRDRRERATQDLVRAMADTERTERSVRLAAVQEISKVATLGAVRNALLERVNPANERDRSIQDAAWQALLELASKLPDVNYRTAIGLADTVGQMPAQTQAEHDVRSQRRVAMLEMAAAKLENLRKQPNVNVVNLSVELADVYQNVGDEYFLLNRWDRAWTDYGLALDLRQQPDVKPITPQSITGYLAERIEKSYLFAGKYKDAVAFAGKRSAEGPRERATMGALIRNEVDRLINDGKLNEASQLADEALHRMNPPLDSDVISDLNDYQRKINQRLSSQEKQGAAPGGAGGQSAAGVH
jgi:tetratricopeptide (TPR) repeat protein